MRALFIAATLAVSLNASAANSDARYDGVPDKFLALMQLGKTDAAVDYLASTNTWSQKVSGQVDQVKVGFKTYAQTMGKYQFAEQVGETHVGSHYAQLAYIVGYERTPVRMDITLYRARDKWVFFGISLDQKPLDDLAVPTISRDARP